VPGPPFDALADRYDETRGGERRGDAYAQALESWLAPGSRVLEVGVGTGVVALGLRRRGHPVTGVDISAPMLARAHTRLGGGVVRGDALRLPFAAGSFPAVVAVWVLHAVRDAAAVLDELGRVVVPGGRLLACPGNRAAPGDIAGRAFELMAQRIDELHGSASKRATTAADILRLGAAGGWRGTVETLPAQSWSSSADDEIRAIVERSWSALLPLDDEQYAAVTDEALAMLHALPAGPLRRRAIAEVVVLDHLGETSVTGRRRP
jgi:ubiquinone/menaquinone biosynthesis C-methylase UbiE